MQKLDLLTRRPVRNNGEKKKNQTHLNSQVSDPVEEVGSPKCTALFFGPGPLFQTASFSTAF